MRTTKAFLLLLAILAFIAVPALAQRTYAIGYRNVYYFNPITGSRTVIHFEGRPYEGHPYDMVITADGRTAYLTLQWGNIAVIDVMTNTVAEIIQTPPWEAALAAIGNGGTRLYVANQRGNEIIIVNIARNSAGGRVNQVLRTVNLSDYAPSNGGAYAIRTCDNAATNTHLLAVGTLSGEVHLFDTTNGLLTYKASAAGFSGVGDLVFSKDGTKLYILTFYQSLIVADATTLSVTKRIDLGGIRWGALQPNGARLFVTGCFPTSSCSAGNSGVFHVIDTVTDTLEQTVPIPGGFAYSIAISNLGPTHGGVTIFMTDREKNRVYIYSYLKKTMHVISLEAEAWPIRIAVTEKKWWVP